MTVSDLVEVVVDYFAKIDEHVLLDLNLRALVNLDSRGVDDSEVANVILSVLANDHQLGLPQFLVVRDLVVVGVTLSNFEYAQTAVEGDCEVLNLFRVDSLKVEMKLVGGCFVRNTLEGSAL